MCFIGNLWLSSELEKFQCSLALLNIKFNSSVLFLRQMYWLTQSELIDPIENSQKWIFFRQSVMVRVQGEWIPKGIRVIDFADFPVLQSLQT